MHRRLSTRSLPTTVNPPTPQGPCTVTQIRHWALRLGNQWTRSSISNWRDHCSSESPSTSSHKIRNRNLYMHCVLAVYTGLTPDAIAKRLNHILGLELCPDVVEFAHQKMKWNGMLERVRRKGPKHRWIMQSMERLSFVEPDTENSYRSASKPREYVFATPSDVHTLCLSEVSTAPPSPPPEPPTRNQRRAQARARSARSPNFTTRRWACKPMWVWLWIVQHRCRIKYIQDGEWQWENPMRRNIWHLKSAYEKPSMPPSSPSEDEKPSVESANGMELSDGSLDGREMRDESSSGRGLNDGSASEREMSGDESASGNRLNDDDDGSVSARETDRETSSPPSSAGQSEIDDRPMSESVRAASTAGSDVDSMDGLAEEMDAMLGI
ncbi:hypothetical protein FGG08_006696 [Glutinoglossum americanum]|uniref:Uncharacterized protein n=1 Tax=Glutinoglossum americanum TaxID=1670608 RepID=A0A9P8L036_9PEZI|nr:hypothetical protein FGG08_006696 [Glutinoglossum americanum]